MYLFIILYNTYFKLRFVIFSTESPILTIRSSREFNHRVKSVSMATFKPEEIDALQKGGNQVFTRSNLYM